MLEEKITRDYQEAMKRKDTVASSTLSFLRAQFMNYAIEKKKKNCDDNDCLAVIKKLIKQHQDSIEQFTKGERLDLAEKEKKELEVLKAYVPQALPPEEIKKIIEQVIAATGASDMKEMGKVMKEVLAQAGAGADAKLVSDLVKELLGKKAQ
ncbi:MAG: GatB/YqeY domain-containing protein [Candidatus Omnitrophota bacterium]|jgi:uncharacterized protein YqeY|nr:MAG: GatB/YqeY domain-containing protein [Candidatus Omnitrophota bacterium]